MIVLLVLLVTLAGISLGLRTTSVLIPPWVHPLDRLALSIVSGALWTAVVFEVSGSYRVFDFGLGLMLSLSPVGLFDLTKWWFRSRGRRAGWLRSGLAPGWLVALRWLFLASLLGAAVLLPLIPDPRSLIPDSPTTSAARPGWRAPSSPGAPAARSAPSSRS